ncbi:MAG: hypothetical protein LAN83_01850 [Acidobacteriia bacterium]|nr:hypothetical protein [Terriglobia bacterium]
MVISPNAPMTSPYDYLVSLSALIAVSLSYLAIDLAGRWRWMTGGATAMGAGISKTHYVSMLALRLPLPVGCHWPAVRESLVL